MSQKLEEILRAKKGSFAQVTPFDLNADKPVIFDLTSQNEELVSIDLHDDDSFNSYIFDKLKANNTDVGLGIYNEDREIYKRSEVFAGNKVRSIHLGIDIWAKEGTPVFAPLAGKIHSFKNNNSHGDYGPTIILQHELEDVTFYTLYGHLSLQSIGNKRIGQRIEKGEEIASIGEFSINVHWPPHLHFQVISDLGDHFGDFPGVAAKPERKKFLENCPDPNLILGVQALEKEVS